MALRTPPSWLQNAAHPAENDRLSNQALYATTGVIGSSSLAVSASSPAAMSVVVAAGWAAIVGTTQANMGTYVAYNDAAATLSVTAANPTNPRIDKVVVTINDAYYTGATNNVVFQVLAGTPAGSPVAPATPANSISLATIAVGAAVTQINTGNITDTRVQVTTNLPVGDLTEVAAGTGITVTSGTGPIPTVAIDSTVATLTGTQTLSNKTIALGSNTVSGTTAQFNTALTDGDFATIAGTETLTNKTLTEPKFASSGFIADANGNELIQFPSTVASAVNQVLIENAATGDGATTGQPTIRAQGNDANISLNLVPKGTGVVQANGVAVVTTSGTQTLTNKTLTSPTVNTATIAGGTIADSVIKGFEEDVNVVASAATGTINFDVSTASVWYYTSNATANHTLNFRYSSGITLNTALAVGDAITLVWLNTNGATAYYPNVIQIDGSTVTPKVPAAISAGNASAIDAYVFTIIKTAATPTYTVLETQTKFA